MIAFTEPPAVNCQPRDGQDLILRVHLEPQHITHGHPSNCIICPWALAIREAAVRAGVKLAGGDSSVKVYGDSANLYLDGGNWYVATCPHSVRQFIRRFDHGLVDYGTSMTVDLHFTHIVPAWDFD